MSSHKYEQDSWFPVGIDVFFFYLENILLCYWWSKNRLFFFFFQIFTSMVVSLSHASNGGNISVSGEGTVCSFRLPLFTVCSHRNKTNGFQCYILNNWLLAICCKNQYNALEYLSVNQLKDLLIRSLNQSTAEKWLKLLAILSSSMCRLLAQSISV